MTCTAQISLVAGHRHEGHRTLTRIGDPFLAQAVGLLHLAAHATNAAKYSSGRVFCRMSVHLEKFPTVIARPNPDRPIAVPGLDILLPQIRWLEDMTVGVNYQLIVALHCALLWARQQCRLSDIPILKIPA